MAVKGLVITWAESIRYLALKISKPVALLLIRLCSCFKIKDSVAKGMEKLEDFLASIGHDF